MGNILGSRLIFSFHENMRNKKANIPYPEYADENPGMVHKMFVFIRNIFTKT
jgi:hypothetical protein